MANRMAEWQRGRQACRNTDKQTGKKSDKQTRKGAGAFPQAGRHGVRGAVAQDRGALLVERAHRRAVLRVVRLRLELLVPPRDPRRVLAGCI